MFIITPISLISLYSSDRNINIKKLDKLSFLVAFYDNYNSYIVYIIVYQS